jgi:hypothetical protein
MENLSHVSVADLIRKSKSLELERGAITLLAIMHAIYNGDHDAVKGLSFPPVSNVGGDVNAVIAGFGYLSVHLHETEEVMRLLNQTGLRDKFAELYGYEVISTTPNIDPVCPKEYVNSLEELIEFLKENGDSMTRNDKFKRGMGGM